MSDILDRKIAAAMSGPRVEIASSMTEAEVRDAYDFQLEQLTRLTSALDILFPDRPRAGVGSIDAAIGFLEEQQRRLVRVPFVPPDACTSPHVFVEQFSNPYDCATCGEGQCYYLHIDVDESTL